jgi:F0F1-type ATP synthase membrane subunit b/b'
MESDFKNEIVNNQTKEKEEVMSISTFIGIVIIIILLMVGAWHFYNVITKRNQEIKNAVQQAQENPEITIIVNEATSTK